VVRRRRRGGEASGTSPDIGASVLGQNSWPNTPPEYRFCPAEGGLRDPSSSPPCHASRRGLLRFRQVRQLMAVLAKLGRNRFPVSFRQIHCLRRLQGCRGWSIRQRSFGGVTCSGRWPADQNSCQILNQCIKLILWKARTASIINCTVSCQSSGAFRAFARFANLWQSWQNSVAIAFPSPSGNSTAGFGCDGDAGSPSLDRYLGCCFILRATLRSMAKTANPGPMQEQ